jgi:hypothetical protein
MRVRMKMSTNSTRTAPHQEAASARNAFRDISAPFGRSLGARQAGSAKQLDVRRGLIGRLLKERWFAPITGDHDSSDLDLTFDRLGQEFYLSGQRLGKTTAEPSNNKVRKA